MKRAAWTMILWTVTLGMSCGPVLARDVARSEAIAGAIEKVIEAQALVGTSAAVLLEGELVFHRHWGLADREKEIPVSDDTRFLIASVTKTFTGLAVLRLAAEGKLDLDGSVRTYVPSFPEKPGPPITARLLAAHRGGIRHYRSGELQTGALFSRHFDSATEAVEVFAADPLVGVPGTPTGYSSFGYNLLAAAVESVSGATFGRHLEETIFEPLGMKRTEIPDFRTPDGPRAKSYLYPRQTTGGKPTPLLARAIDFSYNPGGGAITSTAADLVRYGRVFARAAEMSRGIREAILDAPLDPGAAFGWLHAKDGGGRQTIHATGASEAYQASLTVWPDDDLVVVTLTNTWGIGSRRGGFTLPLGHRIGALLLE